MEKKEIITEIKNIKEYAKENNVPIMQDEGIDFVMSFVNKKQNKNWSNIRLLLVEKRNL